MVVAKTNNNINNNNNNKQSVVAVTLTLVSRVLLFLCSPRASLPSSSVGATAGFDDFALAHTHESINYALLHHKKNSKITI